MRQIIKSFSRASMCICLSVCPQSHFLIDFHQKWRRSKKNPNSENKFVGVNIGPPVPLLCPQNCPKRGVNRHFPSKTEKSENRNILVTSDHHYAICREDTTRQGDVVGGPKRVNNKSKMADGRHLGNKQTGVSRPLLDRFAPNLVCR